MSHRTRPTPDVDCFRETRTPAAIALALAAALGGAVAGCAPPTTESGAETPGWAETDEGPAGGGDAAKAGEPAPPPPPFLPPGNIAATCPVTQRVGKMLAAGACPDADGWDEARLFGNAVPNASPLAKYCIYTWKGSAPPPVGMAPMDGDRPFAEWTHPDCMAVIPSAPSLADQAEMVVRDTLRASFWNAVERPTSLPAPDVTDGVRVAVVDTWPGAGERGNSVHGIGMGGIIDDLTCDLLQGPGAGHGACPIQIAPHLALNLLAPGVRDDVEGGYFGHQSRLATEILEVVTAWQATAPSKKLIVNLSLGWDSAYQDHQTPSGAVVQRASVSAVREALEVAACSGALILAAAGNASFGPHPATGLTYPAAWRSQSTACTGAPLLWAVGGLTHDDRPIYNTRPGGLPMLSAPSELAYGSEIIESQLPGGPPGGTFRPGPFNGSSVGTAVTTAAAALVWMYSPSLTPAQVVQKVRSAGVPLSVPATACASGSCNMVRRVSVCRAARAVAPGGALGVPCKLHGEGGASPPVWTAAQREAVELLVPPKNVFSGPPLTTLLPTSAPCTLPLFVPSGTLTFEGPSACPMEELPSSVLAPTIDPQPAPDPCGACMFALAEPGKSSILDIAVATDVINEVKPQTLVLYHQGAAIARYDGGSLLRDNGISAREGLKAGQVYTLNVEMPEDMEYPVDVDLAVIEWMNVPDIQTTSRVIVQNE